MEETGRRLPQPMLKLQNNKSESSAALSITPDAHSPSSPRLADGCNRASPCPFRFSPGSTSDATPLLPLAADFHEDAAHDMGAGHQAVAFALENSHLAPPHRLAQPLDILHRDTGITSPMVDDNWSGDVDISETNCVSTLKTNKQVHGRVGTRRRKLPDGVSQAIVIRLLTFTIGNLRVGKSGSSRERIVFRLPSIPPLGGIGPVVTMSCAIRSGAN